VCAAVEVLFVCQAIIVCQRVPSCVPACVRVCVHRYVCVCMFVRLLAIFPAWGPGCVYVCVRVRMYLHVCLCVSVRRERVCLCARVDSPSSESLRNQSSG